MSNAAGKLAGKTALITAAGQGIGRAAAQVFAHAGATVWATDINVSSLTGLENCETARLDARDAVMIESVIARSGPLDILFNCAGTVPSGSILECEERDWTEAFDLNVNAMYRTIKATLPGMLSR